MKNQPLILMIIALTNGAVVFPSGKIKGEEDNQEGTDNEAVSVDDLFTNDYIEYDYDREARDLENVNDEDYEVYEDLHPRLQLHILDDEDDEDILLFRTNNEEEQILMTVDEINKVFGRTTKNSKNELSNNEKAKAKDCRKMKKVYSTKTGKCHQPTSQGPCKKNKWFIAKRGRLDGVCRIPPCGEGEVLYRGECQQATGRSSVCPARHRLFLNKRGVGYCDCQQGFSWSF